ncbi:hypothetical protein DSO57_1038759 [Entomophthora muscae]|uniref:Uncharacterized protein n=1 Tax=Entomophthora muscae TaxID=34485 RepID=A0ACC2RPK4_9FUNG|nr:hypothetical protein DSO57_1038759 [Entomophthora muscae]
MQTLSVLGSTLIALVCHCAAQQTSIKLHSLNTPKVVLYGDTLDLEAIFIKTKGESASLQLVQFQYPNKP